MGHVTWPRPLGQFVVRRLGLIMTNRSIKFEVCTLPTTEIQKATQNVKIGVLRAVKVTPGHRQFNHKFLFQFNRNYAFILYGFRVTWLSSRWNQVLQPIATTCCTACSSPFTAASYLLNTAVRCFVKSAKSIYERSEEFWPCVHNIRGISAVFIHFNDSSAKPQQSIR